jgi:anthranilate phosphoribosyltransferase
MLVADTISELINCDLSPASACEHVRQLGSIKVTADVLAQAIETIARSADLEAVETVQGITDLIDCCGTGGSGLPHFNTSTTVAFILAAAGVKVAKFGNKASTSLAGSFDLLEALEISCYLPAVYLKEIAAETNLVFLFAQQFYPALKKLAPIRQSVGIRTVFNLVGPLLNPTKPQFRLLGVPDQGEQQAVASYLASQNYCERAFVVTSESGLDELDPEAANKILQVEKRAIGEILLEPEKNVETGRRAALDLKMNQRIFNAIVNNEKNEFPYYHALVCLNAGAGLSIARKVDNLQEGIARAAELLASGTVLNKLEQCRSVYARYAC